MATESKSTKNSHSANPFEAFADFTTESLNMFKDLKMPAVDYEQMMKIHRKNLEMLSKAQKAAMETAQKLSQAQAEYIRDSLQHMQDHVQEVMSAKTLEERMSCHTNNLKASMEKAMNHSRDMGEMLATTHKEISGAWQKRCQEGMEEAKHMTPGFPGSAQTH